jgi:phosphoribosyl 1,2-cyclic phosphate phosphodiesterase
VFENRAYLRSEEAFFYLIEKDGKRIIYAHDTDEFTPADMEFLTGKRCDIITLDCTNAKLDLNYIGHMGANDNLRMREKLMAIGAADEDTVFVANHFSHNGMLPYEELEARMPGFKVSYDGMQLTTGE